MCHSVTAIRRNGFKVQHVQVISHSTCVLGESGGEVMIMCDVSPKLECAKTDFIYILLCMRTILRVRNQITFNSLRVILHTGPLNKRQ